ncbi:hypothetical protein Q7P37_001853 [Cladosporium fusiforme]
MSTCYSTCQALTCTTAADSDQAKLDMIFNVLDLTNGFLGIVIAILIGYIQARQLRRFYQTKDELEECRPASQQPIEHLAKGPRLPQPNALTSVVTIEDGCSDTKPQSDQRFVRSSCITGISSTDLHIQTKSALIISQRIARDNRESIEVLRSLSITRPPPLLPNAIVSKDTGVDEKAVKLTHCGALA